MSLPMQLGPPQPFPGMPTNPPIMNPGALPALGGGGLVGTVGRVLGGGYVPSVLRWLGIGGAAAAGGAAVEALVDTSTGQVVKTRRRPRKRRKRLLTCSDREDIMFLKGTLGGGELGKSAITAVLTRCGR